LVFGLQFLVNEKYKIKEMQDKNSIEYRVKKEKEKKYKMKNKLQDAR